MTNDVKKVPELRFPEFDGEWEEDKLRDLLKDNVILEQSDGNHGELYPKSSEFTEDGIPYLAASNISNNSISYQNIKYLPLERAKQFKKGVARDGDILLAHNATVGPSVLLKTDFPFVILSTTLTLYRINKVKMDNHFFLNEIRSNNIQNQLKKLMKQTTRNQVPILLQRTMHITYPKTLAEQHKIGSFFSKLDRQIELEEQKLAKLEEQKKGYMQQIFSQQLRFKDENGNEYPEWEEKKLGDILERGNKDKVNEIGKYRRLTISLHGKGLYEVKQERKTKDTRPFYQRFEGELIIGKQNFFNGSIAIVTREFNGFICSNAIMSYKISNHMNRKYLLEYLLQNDFLRKNEYLADGTGQKELSEKKFEELEIKLPNSINEQQKIGVFLERLDNLIEKQSNKLELLKQRKKSFLQKMFV